MAGRSVKITNARGSVRVLAIQIPHTYGWQSSRTRHVVESMLNIA
jgi:hypothetical protein